MNDAPPPAGAGPTHEGTAPLLLELEMPQPGSVIHTGESLLGLGWALADAPITAISVALDDDMLCEAVIGLARSDVAELHVDHPDAARCGFTFMVPLLPRRSGAADLRLLVRTAKGEREHRVPVEVAGTEPPPPDVASVPPSPPALPPLEAPGELEPIRLQLEEARLDAGGALHVRGWALAAREIRSVEVYFGQRSLGFANTGLSRADVANAFPAYRNAMMAGFALNQRLPPEQVGAESVTVVATDGAGETLSATKQASGGGAPAATAAPTLAPMLVTLEETRINELGVLRVRGWAVSLGPIEQVRVMLDDQQIGVAAHNLPREDVAQVHPDYPNGRMSGFLLQLDVPDETLVGRTLHVGVTGMGGIHREVAGTIAAAPMIRRRERGAADIHFNCDAVSLTEAGALYVKGWAVCPGGTAAIEVELDGEVLGSAELGGERPDVGNHYPLIPGSRTAGFRFLGRAASPRAGERTVRLTVRGHDGESRAIVLPVLAAREEGQAAPAAAMPVAVADAGIRYFLDSPARQDGHATETVRGFLSISGWAFSGAGIASIEVFVDGRSQGQAYRGIRREDLQKSFGRKEALRSGFAMLVPPQVLKKGRHDLRVVMRDGAGHVEQVAFSVDAEPSLDGPGPWSLRQKMTQAEGDFGRALLAATGYQPEWTLLLPLGGAAAAQGKRLRATLDSLRPQAYAAWSVVVPVPTAAERDALLDVLAEDPEDLVDRVRIVVAGTDKPFSDLAPPSDAPRLVGLLSPGDLLGEDALLEFAIAAAGPDGADFLYCDERRHDPSDGQTRAFFKPDWSPDLALSTNYVGRMWVASPELLARAGLLLGDIERYGEYDLVLRLTEQARRIVHVPRMMCARAARALDTPALERRALQRAASRRQIVADIKPGCIAGTWRLQRARIGQPLVSIIIPTNGSRGLVRTAIGSIRDKTGYATYEIVVLDNIRDDEGAAEMKAWMREHADTVVDVAEPFNWSRFNNVGAKAAHGDVLLFLNDDIEVTDPDWLDGLLEHALRPEVGAVGPQLLYPDGKVQHAGVFLSRAVGRHAFRFSPRDEPGAFGLALTQRNVISVTGACLMVRREAFEALGGFDEEHEVINNDLDFCLRSRAAGRLVIYTPHVSLIHHEMVSRGEIRDSYNTARFDTAWHELFLLGDPYFNPNLSADYDDYVPEEEPVQALRIGHPVIAREAVRRILAVKLDHIGDFISCFPAFRRLKEKFPNAELTVLAAEASVALAPLEPAIDKVIQFDFFHTRSERGRRAVTKKDLQKLQEQLAPLRFDLAVDLRRQTEARHVLQYTGARWLAGFDTANRTEWLDIAVEWEGDIPRTHKRTHISEALVQFVDAIAVACETDRRIMPGGPAAEAARRAFAAVPELAALAAHTRPLVCVHSGAGADNKQWPLASFSELIDLLVARHDADIVVIGAAEEAATAAQVVGQCRDGARIVSMVGKLPLGRLPMLLAACDLYVGNDSGPKHMAASLGVPTVAVHSGSVDTVEWGPLGPAAVAVRRNMTCSPCYLAKVADCPRGLACLNGIRVGDVYDQCRRLLALFAPTAAPRPGEAS